jgi:hypothetical protein
VAESGKISERLIGDIYSPVPHCIPGPHQYWAAQRHVFSTRRLTAMTKRRSIEDDLRNIINAIYASMVRRLIRVSGRR